MRAGPISGRIVHAVCYVGNKNAKLSRQIFAPETITVLCFDDLTSSYRALFES